MSYEHRRKYSAPVRERYEPRKPLEHYSKEGYDVEYVVQEEVIHLINRGWYKTALDVAIHYGIPSAIFIAKVAYHLYKGFDFTG